MRHDFMEFDDKGIARFERCVFAFWIAGVVLSLGFVGVVIWGIIKLVTHFTS